MKNQSNTHDINWNKSIITVFGLIILCLSSIALVQCKENKTAAANINALNSEISTYKLKNGQLVASKQALELTKQQLKDLVLSKDAELEDMANHFSKVKTVTKIVTNTIIDTISIPYEIEVPCVFERKGKKIGKEYSINYFSNEKGIQLDSLSIKGNLNFITGTKRKWFWGKETNVIDVTTASDFMKFEDIQHYEITKEKKWYQKDAVKMTASVVLFEILRGFLFR